MATPASGALGGYLRRPDLPWPGPLPLLTFLLLCLSCAPSSPSSPPSSVDLCAPLASALQSSEFDPASVVLMHEPGVDLLLPSLHPVASMYPGGAVNGEEAALAHRRFVSELRSHGIRVLLVEEALVHCASLDSLLDLAVESVTYQLINSSSPSPASASTVTDPLLSEEYKRRALSMKSRAELVHLALLQPTLLLESFDATVHAALRLQSVEVQPLSKLVFTRDQQLATAKGVVLGHPMFPNRQRETRVLRAVWRTLGVPLLAELAGDERAEGGDFLSHSPELCFLGVGLRTNWAAAHRLMRDDLLGTQRVVIVVDDGDRHHQRMHLDTVFNLLTPHAALVLADVIDPHRPDRMRHVVEFHRGPSGAYEEAKRSTLAEWLSAEGWQVVTATAQEQVDYALNFLQLGWQGGRFAVVTSYAGLGELVGRAGLNASVEVHHVEYGAVTALYGAAHCTTQALRVPTKHWKWRRETHEAQSSHQEL